MTSHSDANAAIEFLEALLKAKIRLQDAQAEAQPVLESIGSLFEPNPLDEEQKNVIRNGLKSLKKLLEAHAAYGEAVKQAEPARAVVHELLASQPAQPHPTNGKADAKAADDTKATGEAKAASEAKAANEAKTSEGKAKNAAASK